MKINKHILNTEQFYQFNNIPQLIKNGWPLSDKNWFKTGGKAKFYCEPENSNEFQQALEFALTYDIPTFTLGEGANILISDDGIDGLIIRPKLKMVQSISSTTTHELIQADAGVSFNTLIDWCLDNNLTGLEEFSGIPGTVGGAVFINIHYFEFLLSQFLVSAEIIDKNTGQIITVEKDWFNFSYNYSKLHENNFYLVNATFELKKTDSIASAYNRGRKDEIMRHRYKRYPSANTCGSFFRNFYPEEVINTEKKLIYVAYYFDKIGIKGELTVGDAIVSYQHANMIVNRGNATTKDIVNLARQMQSLVEEKFGILPQPECRLLGFKQYPLIS